MTQAFNLAQLGNNTNSSGQVSLTAGVTGTLPVANGGTGAATLTANNVLLGNGTSALQAVAPGTSGNLLTSNGTTWTSAAAPTSYAGISSQIFTGSGTFTIPTGITKIKVTVVGAGGGSGGVPTQGQCSVAYGGPGGGGAMAIQFFSGLTPGNTLTVTVGAGGTAGAAGTNAGGTGGTSSVASGTQTITTVSATGGTGGSGGTNGGNGNVGLGGTASGGLVFVTGMPRTTSSTTAYFSNNNKVGAPSPLAPTSGYTVPPPVESAGVAGYTYGSGASGAWSGTNAFAGAAGGGGLVIIEW